MNVGNYVGDLLYRADCKMRHDRLPIYINAYVEKKCCKNKNWGDDINYWFLKELIESPIRLYNESPLAFRFHSDNYLVIGSTINLLLKPNSIIWGAGCISDKIALSCIPKKVLAVRGPLTSAYLNKNGIECPNIFGDPALLLRNYYHPKVNKKFKLGLIHHVNDISFKLNGASLISMSEYSDWLDVIDRINECEFIASSSLHGLIISEAYGIPNVWTQSSTLLGGHFKFHDFFQSLGTDENNPIIIDSNAKSEDLIKKCRLRGGDHFDLTPLLAASPWHVSSKEIVR